MAIDKSNETCGDIQASFTYLAKLDKYNIEKPYQLWLPAQEGTPTTNCEFEEVEGVVLRNARGKQHEQKLDTTGFEFIHHQSQYQLKAADFDPKMIDSALTPYLKECIELVQRMCQAEKVICCDWRYRKNNVQAKDSREIEVALDRFEARDPSYIVHSDDSYPGGLSRLSRFFTKEERTLYTPDKWRIRCMNIWRPLVDVIDDAPLAMCDRRKIRKKDCVEVDKIHANYIGEEIYLNHHSSQEWYWLPYQTRDEPVLFLTWDSTFKGPGIAGPPHAAFANPLMRLDSPMRESIEVRLIVLNRL